MCLTDVSTVNRLPSRDYTYFDEVSQKFMRNIFHVVQCTTVFMPTMLRKYLIYIHRLSSENVAFNRIEDSAHDTMSGYEIVIVLWGSFANIKPGLIG